MAETSVSRWVSGRGCAVGGAEPISAIRRGGADLVGGAQDLRVFDKFSKLFNVSRRETAL